MRGPCDKLTQAEIWDIATMREAKMPIEDIAKKLQRNTHTVTNVIRSVMAPEFHPQSRGKHSPETIEAMRISWAKGDSASYIADLHGVSKNVVIGLAWRLEFARSPSVEFEARRRNKTNATAARRAKREADPTRPVTRHEIAEAFKLEPYVVQPDEPPLVDNLLALEDGQCKWPIGDPKDKESFGFCGKVRATHYHSYCAGHLMRSIRQPPPPPGQTAANDSQPRHLVAAE